MASLSDRALEMIMRDVLDGLEEWSLESAHQGSSCEFEIIDLQPARHRRLAEDADTPASHEDPSLDDHPGEIIQFNPKRRAWG
jgi:hypothetical protein